MPKSSQTMHVELTEPDRELLVYLLAIHKEALGQDEALDRDDELEQTKRLHERLHAPDEHPDPDLVEEAEQVLELTRATMYPQAAVRAQNLANAIEEAHNDE